MTPDADNPTRSTPLSHRLAGLVFRMLTGTLRWLPVHLGYLLAELLALIALPFVLLHERKVARKGRGLFRNQRIVYRDGLTRAESWRLFFGWVRHMARLLVDFSRMPRLTSRHLERAIDIEQLDQVRPLIEAEDGLICVTGHIGVWEMAGHTAGLLGIPIHSVFRPIPIGPINDEVKRIRTSGGQRVIEKWGALRPMRRAIEAGECIGLVGDESVRRGGMFVPFLGTLAATGTTPARLQRATGAPIVVLSTHRIGVGRFKLHIWKIIRHTRTDDKQADVETVTREINAAISDSILAYPPQWFWGSRRFFLRPEGEAAGPDGLPPVAPAGQPVADLAPGS